LDVPTSSAALKVADVAKEKKKLYFNISAATTDLTGKSCNKYTFHYAYDTYMLANGTGKTTTDNGAKTWYLVYPDYQFGQDMTKSFEAAVTKAGGSVVAKDGAPFPNTSGAAQGANTHAEAGCDWHHAGRRRARVVCQAIQRVQAAGQGCGSRGRA